jgi:hypothetical protein
MLRIARFIEYGDAILAAGLQLFRVMENRCGTDEAVSARRVRPIRWLARPR